MKAVLLFDATKIRCKMISLERVEMKGLKNYVFIAFMVLLITVVLFFQGEKGDHSTGESDSRS